MYGHHVGNLGSGSLQWLVMHVEHATKGKTVT